MNYQGPGTLISSVQTRPDEHIYIVLVKYGSEHVVSRYMDGHGEWVDGHYFPTYGQAYAYFVTEVLETLPVTHIDKPKKLPALVAKLHTFLSVVGASK